MATAEARPESVPGLLAIIHSSRWSIAKKCQAIEQCLDANKDNLHSFLEQVFAALLKALFGYDGPSWLNTAAKVTACSVVRSSSIRPLLPMKTSHGGTYDTDAVQRIPSSLHVCMMWHARHWCLRLWPRSVGITQLTRWQLMTPTRDACALWPDNQCRAAITSASLWMAMCRATPAQTARPW